MKELYKLEDMLKDQIHGIVGKGDISSAELENAYKAVDIIKDIATIEAMHDAGYSNNMPMSYDDYNMANSYRGNSYNQSYDNRRGRDADNDGRYSEARRGRYSRASYAMHDYSRGTMAEHLQEMMSTAKTEAEKQAIQRCMDELNV